MTNRAAVSTCLELPMGPGVCAWLLCLGCTLAAGVVVSACESSEGGPPGRHELAVAEPEAAQPEEQVVVVEQAQPAVAISFRRAPRESLDMDGDGFAAATDPDDADPRVFPLRPEVPCDGIDQDGDGLDACAADLDGDGIRADQDCDDGDPEVTPFAAEVRCNGEDENCDGLDDCDRDGDGYLDRDDFAPDDPAVTSPPREGEPGEGVAEDVEF